MRGTNPLVGGNYPRPDMSYREPTPKGNMYDHDTRQIDGTPMGTALLLLASAGLLVALKAAGFRFSIGVGR